MVKPTVVRSGASWAAAVTEMVAVGVKLWVNEGCAAVAVTDRPVMLVL